MLKNALPVFFDALRLRAGPRLPQEIKHLRAGCPMRHIRVAPIGKKTDFGA